MGEFNMREFPPTPALSVSDFSPEESGRFFQLESLLFSARKDVDIEAQEPNPSCGSMLLTLWP
jgi:hypothetical protein